MSKTKNLLRGVVTSGLLLAFSAVASAAAKTEMINPTEPRESSVPWFAVLCGLICLGGICAVAFKSSRRTHLD